MGNLIPLGKKWFASNDWKPYPFQTAAWKAYLDGKNGLVNAATGSGKTYSLVVPIMLEYLAEQKQAGADVEAKKGTKKRGKNAPNIGLRAIWISPIRALTKEIRDAAERAAEGFGLDWEIAIRTGDTTSAQRAKQLRRPPQILITTPESLHLLLATTGYESMFANLKVLVADEWHELMGSKRGVQVELALSRLRTVNPTLRTWGISATIGNLEEAAHVLFGLQDGQPAPWELIRSKRKKKYKVKTILPTSIENFPWAGRIGTVMVKQVLKVINTGQTTLIFTNTRAQCELWYQALLEADPDLAGLLGMHHSAVDRKLRDWVEDALHEAKLKVVVCTSSLDLGVDFRPVETIIQIGSPMGVARFLQRAGRSGHQPGATSVIHVVPTYALELIDAAALQSAVRETRLESRQPYRRAFDVLTQYLVTLSISGGFFPEAVFTEIKNTHAYAEVTPEEWEWCLRFIRTGGAALEAYPEHHRVGITAEGKYVIQTKQMATRHRMSMGTIVSDTTLRVKYRSGGNIGAISERFVSSLKKGDVFTFSGRVLEFVGISGMEVRVKSSKAKRARTPSWSGGRMPLSAELSLGIREQMGLIHSGDYTSPELKKLRPLMEIQERRSYIPGKDELLVEYYKDREGWHLLVYPFEGRFIHEGISTLLAWRLSRKQSISFSIAVNDYGFELVSDQEIDVEELITTDLFSVDNLREDIRGSANAVEMANRKFREIAVVAGLVFTGFPNARKKDRHLQSSSQLFFKVYSDYEPENLLLRQAYEEVLQFELEETRLRATLHRIQTQRIVITRTKGFSVLAFPIIVNRMREKVSSETLKDRIAKMKLRLVK